MGMTLSSKYFKHSNISEIFIILTYFLRHWGQIPQEKSYENKYNPLVKIQSIFLSSSDHITKCSIGCILSYV